jgi:hypothetical protein
MSAATLLQKRGMQSPQHHDHKPRAAVAEPNSNFTVSCVSKDVSTNPAIPLLVSIRMARLVLESQCLKPLQPRNTATQPTAFYTRTCRYPHTVSRATRTHNPDETLGVPGRPTVAQRGRYGIRKASPSETIHTQWGIYVDRLQPVLRRQYLQTQSGTKTA